MIDLQIDNNFELIIDSQNDLSVVYGDDELRQRLIFRLSLFQTELIGDINSPNALRKVRLETNRALSDEDLVDSIDTLEVEKTDDETIEVFIVYNGDQIINEEL